MAIELYDSVNHDGLLDIQGKAFYALATLNTARLTTIPTEVQDFLAQVKLMATSAQLDWAVTVEGLPDSIYTWQGAGDTLSRQIRANLQAMLIQAVAADASRLPGTIADALDYLVAQMISGGYYVEANTISLTLTPGGSNAGDVAVCYTHRRGDGRIEENALAETIALEVSAASETNPTLQVLAPPIEHNRLAQSWPKGSGTRLSLVGVDPAESLLTNGDFEDTAIANCPDNWIVHVGTLGTTVKVTAAEVQTVVLAGTPTGGGYQLTWANPQGVIRSTAMLAYNASGAAVEAALRQIPGLERVTVVTTGTSPDFTHTITFHGAAGDPAQLASVSHLTGGTPTITHATTTAGNAGAFRGRALEFASDGAEVSALYHPLTPLADTVYFLHARVRRTGAASAGELRFELVDGIGGSVINDSAGNANQLVIDATAISTSAHDSKWFAFRLPKSVTFPVYLRVRISTAITSGCSVFLDDVAITTGRQLYAGGPFLAAFSGRVRAPVGDTWSLAVANNRGATLQEWYARVFDTPDRALLLPTSGSTQIPDSVVG